MVALTQSYICCVGIVKYVQSSTTQLMILLRCILTLFYQRHVSALVLSHLQVDYSSLSKAKHRIGNAVVIVTSSRR